ncbi:MAG: ABC transporter substrate-binding protein [Alphaproteobacteria bacterium]|nr:ABC transporter substrate-binding protein [Alphaproteobacteria bacterium]
MRLVTWVIASAVAIASTGSAAAEPVKIRIGWNQAPGHMASMTWYDTKAPYLQFYGKSYIAEPMRFQGTGHQVTAIAADQVDIAAVSVDGLVSMVENAELNAQVVADVLNDPCDGQAFTQPFYARKDSGIRTLADLKGKRIAINSRGSGHDMCVSGALRKGNVADSEVTRVEMQFGAMVPFLKEGKVDVGGYLPQFVPAVDSDPNLFRLFTACDSLGPTATVLLVAKKEFIAKNRAALVDMFADHMAAVRWFYDPKNRDKMLETVVAVTKGKREDFENFVFTKTDFYRNQDLFIDPKSVQNTIDKAVDLGAIKKGIKVVPNHADMSIIADAKKKLEGKM